MHLPHIQKARRSPIASFTYVFNDSNFKCSCLMKKLHPSYTVAFCNGMQNQLCGHQLFQESSPLSSAIPPISISTQFNHQSVSPLPDFVQRVMHVFNQVEEGKPINVLELSLILHQPLPSRIIPPRIEQHAVPKVCAPLHSQLTPGQQTS